MKERKRLKRVIDIWNLGQGYSNKKSEVRHRKSEDKEDPQKKFDLLIKETEEQLRRIYGDPDIEQLPSKLNSVRR